LDYSFVTPSLVSKITGANKWHINSDEPIFKDYNQEFNPAYAYSPDAFRSSDHDPVLVGFNLGNIKPVVTITSPSNNAVYSPASTVTVQANASDADGSITKVVLYVDGRYYATDSIAPYQFSGSGIDPSSFQVRVAAFDNAGDSTLSDTIHITVEGCSASGNILGQGFLNIPGSQVSDLTSNSAYPDSASIVAYLPSFEYSNVGTNYGGRVRGYICPPVTGNYTFYIAGDDQAGLYLSTDDKEANKTLIAYNEGPVGYREWTRYSTQKSVPIHLIKGGKYYIESIHKQGTGANHLSVGWILPNGVAERPITGARLSPFVLPTSAQPVVTTTGFTQAMQKAQREVNGELELSVVATPNPFNQWFDLKIQSKSAEPLNIVVSDLSGKVVEKYAGVNSNGTVRLGSQLRAAGVYIVEVAQGGNKKRVKVVKQ
jgi:hypothetical protein